MFITGLSLLFCLLFGLPTAALAASDIRGEGCGNNPERPYVCDIGAPKVLSKQEFIEVLAKNEALRETVKRLGRPEPGPNPGRTRAEPGRTRPNPDEPGIPRLLGNPSVFQAIAQNQSSNSFWTYFNRFENLSDFQENIMA